MEQQPKNVHQFFETLLIVAESVIDLNEPAYARKLLTTLSGLCNEDEYGHRLKVQYVWMRYYKNYGEPEERMDAYEEFYELRQMSDMILNRNLADGLLSKIKLRESVKQNREMAKNQELLEDEVQLDELTQLYNRRSFRKLTEQVAADPQVESLCMMMIDVDYFKQYNDTYGHSMGDDALRAVADSMRAASDKRVYSFRYGGDEYVAMCKNMTAEEIEQFIGAVRADLQHKCISHEMSACSGFLSLSIGYSLHSRQEGAPLDVTQMMDEADKALYWSKGKGRNCHHRYSDMMHKV